MNIKSNYNKEMRSKIMDTGVQFKFNDDLICAIEKFNVWIQPAVAKNKKFNELQNYDKTKRGGTKRSKTQRENYKTAVKRKSLGGRRRSMTH